MASMDLFRGLLLTTKDDQRMLITMGKVNGSAARN